MAKEQRKEAVNFKQLYNKRYGDIVTMHRTHTYTPEQVFDLAIRYFEWAEENAIKASETAAFQGIVKESRVHKPRVFTINGLCLFCGFSDSVISKWRREAGFSEVIEFIDKVIYEQKFQLAANGIVNASFMGKELGIDSGITTNVSVETNSTTQSIDSVTADEVRDAVRDILAEI